ncbi:hypothetical protein ACX0G9_22455 [Flavitalea flava]
MRINFKHFGIPVKRLLGKSVPHVVAVLIFFLVAVIYCKPVFEGKVLIQEDILQWQGMASNSFQYKETHGHFPLWSNGMFGGMPAYQIAMETGVWDIPGLFYNLMILNLKKPASFFFLASLCFYFLTRVLRINPYIGIIGGLAYAYATYNPVIISVGHETKMQSIALLPAFIGSLILIYERKYWLGATLTIFFTALLVSFGHMQIVYYGLITAIGLSIGYFIHWALRKEYSRLFISGAIALSAGIVGILANSVVLFTTYDSSKETVRGGSELADAKSNYTGNGLSNDLAFDFSMYKTEPLVMLVPDLYGGTTESGLPEENSKAAEVLRHLPAPVQEEMQGSLHMYWGGIGEMVAGPPYTGAVICFLALIGFFILDNKHKWWILGTCLFTLAMSWGGYFEGFNSFLLRWLPMYNKFRAPSMIMIVPVFLFCTMAVLAMQKIMVSGRQSIQSLKPAQSFQTGQSFRSSQIAALWRNYKMGLLLVTGIFGLLLLFYFTFDYTSPADKQLLAQAGSPGGRYVNQFRSVLHGLIEDRRALFLASLLRSFLFISAAALLTGLYIKSTRVRPAFLLGLLGMLSFTDIIGVDWKYLNFDDYKIQKEYQQNFVATPADREILRDKGYYRVFDMRDGDSNALSYGAMGAYFHHSIGGYHAAKLKIYEDLIDHQLYNFPDCQPVLNMLNTKYIIRTTAFGQDSLVRNSAALGPAWFVQAVRFEDGPRKVMNALTHFNPGDTAILFGTDRSLVYAGLNEGHPNPGERILGNPEQTHLNYGHSPEGSQKGGNQNEGNIRDAIFKPNESRPEDIKPVDLRPSDSHPKGPDGTLVLPGEEVQDSSATLQLIKNDNDEIAYRTDSRTARFAVFSEVYYNRGWRAWIDNLETPIIRTNYVLRGLVVPAGHHSIRFIFRPASYYLGRQLQSMATLILLLLIIGTLIVSFQESRLPVYIFWMKRIRRSFLNLKTESLSS